MPHNREREGLPLILVGSAIVQFSSLNTDPVPVGLSK